MNRSLNHGFTLIEVLIALMITAIALTALIKATSENITNTNRIKNKTISHWVAMQGITLVKLNMVTIQNGQATTEVTDMLGELWYWRVTVSPSAIPSVQQIQVLVSQDASGPFHDPLIGYRYVPS
jgi:general secretion pathway protein I